MAKIKLAPHLLDIRGTLGGAIYKCWRGIHILGAARVTTALQDTEYQKQVRGALTRFSALWGTSLNDIERAQWTAFAQKLCDIHPPDKPFLRGVIIPRRKSSGTGYHTFVGYNVFFQSMDVFDPAGGLDVPPPDSDIPVPILSGVQFVGGRIQFFITPSFAHTEKLYCRVWIKGNSNKTFCYRTLEGDLEWVSGTASQWVQLTTRRTLVGGVVTEKLFMTDPTPSNLYSIQAVFMDESGRISVPSEIVTGKVIAGGVNMKYVDRGDPAAYDFDQTVLVTDGAWHDLNLSSIVPAEGASHLVHLCFNIVDDSAGKYIQFREKGNSNAYNVLDLINQVANFPIIYDGFVLMDSSRVIEYRCSNTVFTTLGIVVRGWWTD